MTSEPDDRRRAPDSRDVAPAEMATLLRAVLGLDPHRQLPEERAADLRRPMPRGHPRRRDRAVARVLPHRAHAFRRAKAPNLPRLHRNVEASHRRARDASHQQISRSSVVLGVFEADASRGHASGGTLSVGARARRRGCADHLPVRYEPGPLPEATEDGSAGTVQFEPRKCRRGRGPVVACARRTTGAAVSGRVVRCRDRDGYARSRSHAFEEIGGTWQLS